MDLLATNAIKTVDITSSVPSTRRSSSSSPRRIGVGIHDREGVALGESYTRSTRSRGRRAPAGRRRTTCRWSATTAPSSSAASISLPLNATGHLPWRSTPRHSACTRPILNLDDPSSPGHRLPDAQHRGRPLRTFSRHRATRRPSRAPWPATRRCTTSSPFLPGTPAFKVDFGGHRPPGRDRPVPSLPPVRRAKSKRRPTACLLLAARVPGGLPRCGPLSRTVPSPQSGVWEVTVEARRTSDVGLDTVRADRVDPGRERQPEPGHHPERDDRRPGRAELHADEHLRRVHRPGRRYDARQRVQSPRRPSRTSPSRQYRRDGHGRLHAPASDDRQPIRPGGRPGPVRVQLHAGTCVLAGQSADGDSEESVTIANPAAASGWSLSTASPFPLARRLQLR